MKNELVTYNRDDAFKIADILINNGYVVMLSIEENLTVVDYLDGTYCDSLSRVVSDRNAVSFMSREEFEDELFRTEDDE